MCLDRVDKTFEDDNDKVVTGYQFRDFKEGFYTALCNPSKLKLNRWSKQRTIEKIPKAWNYRLGFHIYANKKDVKNNSGGWCLYPETKIIKVQGKGLLAVGKNDKEDYGKTYVTRQLKVVEDLGLADKRYSVDKWRIKQ